MTRKYCLYKNVQKMEQEKGIKNFNFIPITFLLSYELDDFSFRLILKYSFSFNPCLRYF